MKPENKKFRVELGVNLNAAPVQQTNPNMRIFPLQNALIDITEGVNVTEDGSCGPKPAWYSHLGIGDEISFRLVDISKLRVPSWEPDYPSFALAEFYFNNPVTGQPANPFTESVSDWQFSDRLEDQVSPVYSMNPTHRLPTWDFIGRNAEGEEFESMEFVEFPVLPEGSERESFRAFELTVAIKLVRDGWVNHYVFDPEMIVSETDNEGDGSGGKKR